MMKDGTYVILDAGKLEVTHEDRKSKMWITDIKYSPNGGKLVGMSSADGRIYIHDSDNYELKVVTQKVQQTIVAFDWDSAGEHLQCTTDDFRLLFFTAADGKAVTSNAKLRDTKWATQTCTLGWNVQGVWPKDDAAKMVNVSTVDRAEKRSVLACGKDDGSVRVYNYPTQVKDMKYSEGQGGSNFVSSVRFNCNEDTIVSMGANNRVIMQYKLVEPLANANK
jgi:WD40 repeat protein